MMVCECGAETLCHDAVSTLTSEVEAILHTYGVLQDSWQQLDAKIERLTDSKNAGWAIAQARLRRINELHETIQTLQSTGQALMDVMVNIHRSAVEYGDDISGVFLQGLTQDVIDAANEKLNHDH